MKPKTHTHVSRRTMLMALATSPLAWVTAGKAAVQERAPLVARTDPLQISGIYPHLAVFNDGGDQDRECGIGAVVVWADKLWLMTYPPHRRTGSPDKLYEIDEQLRMTVRPESVGGTHAGRHDPPRVAAARDGAVLHRRQGTGASRRSEAGVPRAHHRRCADT